MTTLIHLTHPVLHEELLDDKLRHNAFDWGSEFSRAQLGHVTNRHQGGKEVGGVQLHVLLQVLETWMCSCYKYMYAIEMHIYWLTCLL